NARCAPLQFTILVPAVKQPGARQLPGCSIVQAFPQLLCAAGFQLISVITGFKGEPLFFADESRVRSVVFIQLYSFQSLSPPGATRRADEFTIGLAVRCDGKILLGKYARHALIARIVLPSAHERRGSGISGSE